MWPKYKNEAIQEALWFEGSGEVWKEGKRTG
jgi:hypothetical protein